MAATTEAPKYIAVDGDGKATSRRFHIFKDCPSLSDDGTVIDIRHGEIVLLGLKGCSICDKRATGGPAIEALEGFFGEDWPGDQPMEDSGPDELAWKLYEYLKERNFYIARRQPKSDS